MGKAWLNTAAIKGAIRSAAREELEVIGDEIAADAKRRAPVRKVFRERPGYQRRFRRLTTSERAVASRLAENYYRNIRPNEFKRRRALAHIANYARVQRPGPGSLNALERSRRLRTLGFERGGRFSSTTGARRLSRREGGGIDPGAITPLLTSRGAYEIRSGRAVHRETLSSGHTRVQAGGALKASIGSEGVSETPNGLEVKVTAAIRYAKYVEFPTIRTAAQPFLRPALHAAREAIPRRLASAIGKALPGR